MQEKFQKVTSGIQNPRKAISHVLENTKLNRPYRQYLDMKYGYLYRNIKRIPKQKRIIEDIKEGHEFAIVVLDACRYDYFEELYNDYFDGRLTKVWASANSTPNYIASTWSGFHNISYLSALPWTSDLAWESIEEKDPYLSVTSQGYRPSEHINNIQNIWIDRWDATQFTVPPDEMTRAAIRSAGGSDKTRMVVHYLQPHRPYIGDPAISPWSEEIDKESIGREPDADLDKVFSNRSEVRLEDIYRYDLGWKEFAEYDLDFPRFDIKEAVKSGNLTTQEFREAYRGNLHLVLESVAKLDHQLDCQLYITADHGEFLGEGSRFLHSNFTHPILREVPLLKVDSAHTEFDEVELHEEQRSDSDAGDYSVKERLEQLGYLRDD